MTVEPFTRVLTPVHFIDHRDHKYLTFVTVKWDGTRLSITGVEGPTANGNALGSPGQCRDFEGPPCQGWTEQMVERLREIWNAWHLNDMRAGCEHQRAEKWNERPIDPTKPLEAYGCHFEGQQQDSWNMLVWVRPDEHPEGLLTKACNVCGYQYGSAWLTEEVPDTVLAELLAFPVATATMPGAWR